MITYYKSRNLSPDHARPFVYVQEEGRWKIYAPGGFAGDHMYYVSLQSVGEPSVSLAELQQAVLNSFQAGQ